MTKSEYDCSRWWGQAHVWTKWISNEPKNIINIDTKGIIGTVIVQSRKCTRCGFKEYDKRTIWAA